MSEIQVTSQLRVSKGYLADDFDPGIQQITMTGSRMDKKVQDIPADAHELLNISADIGTAGWGAMRNLDTTNFIRVGIVAGALSAPATPTVTPQGTTGTTEYSYSITALDPNGETTPSGSRLIANGNAILSATNFNRITWTAVAGATGYKVYGRTDGAEQLIATLGAVTQYDDTGAVTPAGARPTADTTGFQPFAKLLPGEAFPIPLATKTLYARADTATASLLLMILER